MMRNRSFTAGYKKALGIVIVILIAAVLMGSFLGFGKSRDTHGYTSYSASLNVAYDSAEFDFDALRADALALLPAGAEVDFEASFSTGYAIMSVVFVPVNDKDISLDEVGEMIASDYPDAGSEFTFTRAAYSPSIGFNDYGVYAVRLVFLLVVAFVLLCIFYNYRNPFSAWTTVLAAFCDVALVVGLHAIFRLPAGRSLLAGAALALVSSMFVNFFLIAELGNTKLALGNKFNSEEADEILYAGYQKNTRAAILILVLLGCVAGTAVVMGAYGLALYCASCALGIVAPLFTSPLLYAAAYGASLAKSKTKK